MPISWWKDGEPSEPIGVWNATHAVRAPAWLHDSNYPIPRGTHLIEAQLWPDGVVSVARLSVLAGDGSRRPIEIYLTSFMLELWDKKDSPVTLLQGFEFYDEWVDEGAGYRYGVRRTRPT